MQNIPFVKFVYGRARQKWAFEYLCKSRSTSTEHQECYVLSFRFEYQPGIKQKRRLNLGIWTNKRGFLLWIGQIWDKVPLGYKIPNFNRLRCLEAPLPKSQYTVEVADKTRIIFLICKSYSIYSIQIQITTPECLVYVHHNCKISFPLPDCQSNWPGVCLSQILRGLFLSSLRIS